MPVFDVDLRRRLNNISYHFYDIFHNFAVEQGDMTFDVRLCLSLARSFLTSTRFEVNENFSGLMFQNARMLMQSVIAHHGTSWESFVFPR